MPFGLEEGNTSRILRTKAMNIYPPNDGGWTARILGWHCDPWNMMHNILENAHQQKAFPQHGWFACLFVYWRAYKRYSECVRPVQSSCTDGLDRLLQYEVDLRRYLLKMSRICDDVVLPGLYDWLITINTVASLVSSHGANWSSQSFIQCYVWLWRFVAKHFARNCPKRCGSLQVVATDL